MKLKIIATALAAGCTLIAHAGSVSDAAIAGQVQQFIDAGEVTGCGVTLSAIELLSSPNQTAQVFNGGLSLIGPYGGLVKGKASTVAGKRLLAGDVSAARVQKTEMVWVKAPGAAATTVMEGQKIAHSDDPGFIMYAADIRALAAVLTAVQESKPIQIGMRTAGSKFDVILAGVVQLSEAQQLQLAQCTVEWAEHVKRKVNLAE